MTTPLFSNQVIDSAQLAQYQHQQVTPLQPTHIKANVVLRLISTGIVLLLLAVARWQTISPFSAEAQENLSIALMVVAALALMLNIYGYFADKAKGYVLRESDISFYTGVFFKKVVIQPLLRLQHIELKRGPIERKLDLATIQVFSAGGALHTFELPGLYHQDALALRQFILAHKDVSAHE
ncbi:PH domain-containing protein [Psychrobium sp. 1_MG-2023]|uniref:PH domain-containing protein n=1 Tax=Psychrobium sp. 1_MG-2023 TaxID=3062624 RepID=UPI000C33F666|nr:PH domain-containing protein [Psychrobium sp. 1_MG-2023]MDP2561484.1 PH domain-containing protein [Psychrobium sp. 1_MG-2023]PKF57750.1 hypothetical protein CW748_06025 [Alteromonadales bacterium alter-6D02]